MSAYIQDFIRARKWSSHTIWNITMNNGAPHTIIRGCTAGRMSTGVQWNYISPQGTIRKLYPKTVLSALVILVGAYNTYIIMRMFNNSDHVTRLYEYRRDTQSADKEKYRKLCKSIRKVKWAA